MKRICFVDYDMSVTGGAEQVTASLANVLCREYEVYVYSINGNENGAAYRFDERVCYHQELQGVTRLRQMITGVFRSFCDFVKSEKIDVVITMGNYPALIVALTRFFTKAKYVYCDHGALMNQWHQKDITAIRYLDAVLSHKIVTLTEQTRKDYIEKFHMKPKKVQCIYNWISPEVLEARSTYDEKSKCILTVGRFGKEKGYDLLVKVARQVLPKHTDWQWHLYGTGETFETIQEQVISLGLSNQLILKGNVKEVYKMYKHYALLVLPSYREGLPLVLLEANANGLPMVSFDIMTGPNEIIVDGENGFLVPAYDCGAMADKIEQLIENDSLRVAQSKATEKYLEKFEYQNILKQWKVLIEE